MYLDRTLDSTNSFSELHNLIRASSVSLSFFGSRRVSVPGYEGSVLLNRVKNQWYLLNDQRNQECYFPNRPPYSFEECLAAVATHNKISALEDVSDAMIRASKNVFVVFSRIINSITWDSLLGIFGLHTCGVFGESDIISKARDFGLTVSYPAAFLQTHTLD